MTKQMSKMEMFMNPKGPQYFYTYHMMEGLQGGNMILPIGK